MLSLGSWPVVIGEPGPAVAVFGVLVVLTIFPGLPILALCGVAMTRLDILSRRSSGGEQSRFRPMHRLHLLGQTRLTGSHWSSIS